MHWIFHPRVIEARKTHKIWIRFKFVEGQASLEKRFGRILKTDNPETQALDAEGKPTTVDIEYSDNQSKPMRKRFPVTALAPIGPKNNCKLIIIKGSNTGTVVKHIKTIRDKVSVKPLCGGKSYLLPKDMVCPIED